MQKAMFAEYRAGLATGLRTLQRRARAAALIAIYLGCMATAGETPITCWLSSNRRSEPARKCHSNYHRADGEQTGRETLSAKELRL